VATLSLALWALALDFLPVRRITLTGMIALDQVACLERADRALLTAVEAVGGKDETRRSVARTRDFLLYGLGQELAASVYASVTLLHQKCCPILLEDADRHCRKTLADALGLIALADDARPAAIEGTTSARLIEDGETLMRLSSLIWHRFDLAYWASLFDLRRFQFRALLSEDTTAENSGSQLYRRVSAYTERADLRGLLANFAIADALPGKHELSAIRLARAAELAVSRGFGRELTGDLCVLAVKNCNRYGWLQKTVIQRAFERLDARPGRMELYLQSIAEHDVVGWVLRLRNLLAREADASLSLQIQSAVTGMRGKITDAGIMRDFEALLEQEALEDSASAGEVPDAPAVLAAWSDRKDLWEYAGVLKVLWRSAPHDEALLREVVSLLQRDPAADHYSTYFSLAISVAPAIAERTGNDADADVVRTYLAEAVEFWKNETGIRDVIAAYNALFMLDHDANQRELYMAHITHWKWQQFEADQLARYPEMAVNGEYITLFQEYTFAMLVRGLPVELEYDEFLRLSSAPAAERLATIRQWYEGGAIVPAPFADVGAGEQVAADFLRIGHFLFSDPCLREETYNLARTAFDQAAEAALQPLLDRIISTADLPDVMARLLGEFKHRLEVGPVPAEG
jgi:hypothetical protein